MLRNRDDRRRKICTHLKSHILYCKTFISKRLGTFYKQSSRKTTKRSAMSMMAEWLSKNEDPDTLMGVGAVVMVVGLFFSVAGLVLLEPATWEETHGTITGTRIREYKTLAEDKVEYWLYGEYSFSVDGVEYSGDKATPYNGHPVFESENRQEVEQEASRYKVGDPVAVHYAAGKPNRNAMETRTAPQFVFLILGLVLLVPSSIVFYVSWKVRKKEVSDRLVRTSSDAVSE